MASIQSLKDRWGVGISPLQNKVSAIYDTEEKTAYNPFLDKRGSLVNGYLNYQKMLDDPSVSEKAKAYIMDATGLTPNTYTDTSASYVSSDDATPSSSTQTSSTSGKASSSSAKTSGTTATPTGNSIADNAQKYLGTPYVWGGESMAEGGMDCSGFVYNALKDSGYSVGRTTAQGYRGGGTKVSKSDLKPGDLIFYGKNGNNASHIGIYVGDGKMIHSSGGSKNTASNPGKGVIISNVDYRSDFIEARRY